MLLSLALPSIVSSLPLLTLFSFLSAIHSPGSLFSSLPSFEWSIALACPMTLLNIEVVTLSTHSDRNHDRPRPPTPTPSPPPPLFRFSLFPSSSPSHLSPTPFSLYSNSIILDWVVVQSLLVIFNQTVSLGWVGDSYLLTRFVLFWLFKFLGYLCIDFYIHLFINSFLQ